MRVVCIGGGPAGVYASALLKRSHPSWSIEIIERAPPHEMAGFGVVLSASALESLERADPDTYRLIAPMLWRWSDVHVHARGRIVAAAGQRFAAVDRFELLSALRRRCEELGVALRFSERVDDVDACAREADLLIGADGSASRVRERFADELGARVAWGNNRFIWLGTSFPFEAFTFYVKPSIHGVFCIHAYRYRRDASTFVAECAEATWRRAGLDRADERETLGVLERLFADELHGHRLWSRRSAWRPFATIHARRWHVDHVVLIGDAAHAAHFSIGSGTRLAMDDAIALNEAFRAGGTVTDALAGYEAARRPNVESFAEAARASQAFFEGLDRSGDENAVAFTYRLLTRSGRSPRLRPEDLSVS